MQIAMQIEDIWDAIKVTNDAVATLTTNVRTLTLDLAKTNAAMDIRFNTLTTLVSTVLDRQDAIMSRRAQLADELSLQMTHDDDQ
jgi:hypothetical protein